LPLRKRGIIRTIGVISRITRACAGGAQLLRMRSNIQRHRWIAGGMLIACMATTLESFGSHVANLGRAAARDAFHVSISKVYTTFFFIAPT
jgi:alkylation response protein AidB-like acyl-CoA dehydrogenase